MICLLHVAICDDEETFVQHLNALLTRYAQETGIALKISTYRDGADLVDPYDASLDLIFLDIQMCAMDGLRAAEQIRKLDSKVAIIFLTTLTPIRSGGLPIPGNQLHHKAASIHPSQGRDG